MNTLTTRLLAGLLMTALFAACSRPVAYFQRGPVAHYATQTATATATAPVTMTDATMPAPAAVTTSVTPAQQVASAGAALDQMEAYVRNDRKLAADKTVQKRLNRVRTLLNSAAAKATTTPAVTNGAASTKKLSLVERLMVKKLNKQLNRRLAPDQTKRAMASTGVLAAGAVLVIVGLILLLAGSSTTVGVILLLAGAVVLVVGLLA